MTDPPAVESRAKIVCTLGPASNTLAVIREMIRAGMNVARLNFSHGTHEEHRRVIAAVRQAALEEGRIVGIMADLQGPKVRVGSFRGGQAQLAPGSRFVVTARDVEGGAEIVSTTYRGLPGDLKPGDTLLLDDGLLNLTVTDIAGPDIGCRVVVGGTLKDHKGINVPSARLSVAAITEKDYQDAAFALGEEVDFLAMSFVRQPDDVLRMREFLAREGARAAIVAKIEKPQALEAIDDIIAVSDAIMVARGDLGVEMAAWDVPAIQKRLISRCNREGKPVITATQMLESMVVNPRPTRAEASDVANAVLDGSDAVMLSAESASGRYPVEAVTVMKRIIAATEATRRPSEARLRRGVDASLPVQAGIAAAAGQLAEQVGARAIASITLSGSIALAIAQHRPPTPLFAISQHAPVLRALSVVWGVEGLLMPDLTTDMDNAVRAVEAALVAHGKLRPGDLLVLTAGQPFSERKATNMVRVDRVPPAQG
jgi:pyruvate kinase